MAPLVTWGLLAASFVVGLAAVVRMAGPAAGVDHWSGVVRLPDVVRGPVFGLFALAVVVFVSDLVRRGLFRRRPPDGEPGPEEAEAAPIPPWLRAVIQIASLVNIVVLAYLVWRGAIPLGDLLALVSGAGSAAGLGAGADADSAPLFLTWTFGILALVAALGALALALWSALGDRRRRGPDAEPNESLPMGETAPPATPIDADPGAERDPRRAIVACYRLFERAAAGIGVERQPYVTPMEFMREAGRRLPMPGHALPTLTALFERARFSHHALGPGERQEALQALGELRASIATRAADAVPR